MKCIGIVLLIFAMVAGHAQAQSAAAPAPEGAAVDGLRLRLAVAVRDSTPPGVGSFLATLENVGDRDFVVNLGWMLGNGKVMWPSAIRLSLTASNGSTSELTFFDRRYPVIRGRVDAFFVPLRVGSSYTVLLNLDDYRNSATNEFVSSLKQGTYRLSACLDGAAAEAVNSDMKGVPLLNFWKGTVRSNVVEFDSRR